MRVSYRREAYTYMVGFAATPFFGTLSAQGILDYPLFGLSLTRNTSGSITLGAYIPFNLTRGLHPLTTAAFTRRHRCFRRSKCQRHSVERGGAVLANRHAIEYVGVPSLGNLYVTIFCACQLGSRNER